MKFWIGMIFCLSLMGAHAFAREATEFDRFVGRYNVSQSRGYAGAVTALTLSQVENGIQMNLELENGLVETRLLVPYQTKLWWAFFSYAFENNSRRPIYTERYQSVDHTLSSTREVSLWSSPEGLLLTDMTVSCTLDSCQVSDDKRMMLKR